MSDKSDDPFAPGPYGVGVRTMHARDHERGISFAWEAWYPADAGGRDARARSGPHPFVGFSHASGSHRCSATFLCTHLASHGYVVAAMDHSEVSDPALARREGESAQERARRIEAVIASRVPDLRFLLDEVLGGSGSGELGVDAGRVGLAGHSFGGWAVLAAAQADPRVRAVVALAPGGASRRHPGILPVELAFDARPDVPTLYLVAEDDTSLPLEGMREIYARTPAAKRMVVLRRADHCHFMDDVEKVHESLRAQAWEGELAWMARMKPMAELCRGEDAHRFIRGLALAHLDAALNGAPAALRLLEGDLAAQLAHRGIDAFVEA